MFSVALKIPFCAGHRILGHRGKCKYLHGHNYVAEIQCSTSNVNAMGMVIDFSDIKEAVKTWIDENWDHNLLLNSKDPLYEPDFVSIEHRFDIFNGKHPFIFPAINPTAENMAEHLFIRLRKQLPCIDSVTIHEQDNARATYQE